MNGTHGYVRDSALDTLLTTLAPRRSPVRAHRQVPDVTVVIPAFNHWTATRDCLISVLRSDPELELQIVVVDDASEDETPERLAALSGVDHLRNGRNLGFGFSCNRGAAIADAPFLYFLNNDTVVRPSAIRALVDRMRADAQAGVVGSKLVYPDGALQEAGGIIWSDGNAYNFGRNDDPAKSIYCFAREVDYVSGASLLVRTNVFRAVGFDSRFAPAYYEDADLCFAIRDQGMRVWYEPLSVVVHHEGLTAGTTTESGAKRFQETHRRYFFEKWRDVLERDHIHHRTGDIYRAARLRGDDAATILFLDESVPKYDRDAASQRLSQLIAAFRRHRFRVVFFPSDLAAPLPYTRDLQEAGIEVVYGARSPLERQDLLRSALAGVDVVWMCRPAVSREYLHHIRSVSSAAIIYDSVDLAHLRLRAQMQYDENATEAVWREWEAFERACALAADGVVVVTESERELLRRTGVERIELLPTIHDAMVFGPRPFWETDGLVFIGGFNHQPNIDAVTWLVNEIMPLVWERWPDVRVTLLGSDPPGVVTALAGERVTVPGYIADVDRFFLTARAFVAPLRYGAGIKGKVGQALSFAVPVITTTVGAEGFDLHDRHNAMIADDAPTFARAILELYESEELWSRIASRTLSVLEPFHSTVVVEKAIAFVEDLVRDTASRTQASVKE